MNFMDKAKDLASQAKEKATEVAGGIAEKAAPLADKAGDLAAKGVDATAGGLNKVTGGRFEDQIEKVSNKVEGVLDRDGSAKPKPEEGDAGPAAEAGPDPAK